MLSCNPLAELSKPSSDLRLDGLRRDRQSFGDLRHGASVSPAQHAYLAAPVGHLGKHLIYGRGELRS